MSGTPPLGDLSEFPAPEARFDEDFLFHLFRGRDLLQDGAFEQAQAELERALSFQPQDLEGRGLLGLVQMRLGDYPRAIEIFKEVVAASPEALTPKLNLLLCYLKADRVEEAHGLLEGVLQAGPDPLRLWGEPAPSVVQQPELPKTAPPPAQGATSPTIPAAPVRGPTTLDEVVSAHRVPELPSGSGRASDGLVFIQVRERFALRGGRVRALSPAKGGLRPKPLVRRIRGQDTAEPFGGASSGFSLLEGPGLVVLEPGPGRSLFLLELSEQFLYLRESRLVGFDGALGYENGRLPAADPGPIPMVQFSGRGVLVFESVRGVHALRVGPEQALMVRAASVLGWSGRLLGQALPADPSTTLGAGFVEFNGEGSVLVDDQ